VLSEEALILGVLAGACMLLVLGVLEQVWPSRPRHPIRRPRALPPSPPTPARPAEQAMSPRMTLSLSPSRPPAETVFRRPPGYIEPPARVAPVPQVVPVAPVQSVKPAEPPTPAEPVASPEPVTPPEPVARPKLIVSAELVTPVESVVPEESEPPVTPQPPTNVVQFRERREPVAMPEERDIEPSEPVRAEHSAAFPPPAPAAQPAERRRRSRISPHARPHRVLRPSESPAEAGAAPPPADVPKLGGGPIAPVQPLRQWDQAAEPKPKRDSPLVETCFALYQEKRYSEVVSAGEEMLARLPVQWPAGTSHDIAALQSVIGLAKQALGDDDGARLALEAAIDASPETERSTYRLHLAALSLDAAQARLTRAAGHDTGDRIATIRSAIAWSERGLAAVASDAGLAGAREAAYDALWHAYELSATALLQRQDFGGARQLLREALDDPALPAVRAAGFRGLFSSTFGAEVGQLTAQAILGMQEGHEVEALESLKKAEVVLASIPGDALPQTRRDEIDQRLWWGYAELGSRRLEAGEYEDALDPLIHALRFESIGAERQAETRAAIVRALEGISAMRAMAIRRLADASCHDEAVEGAEDLRKLLRDCIDLGISEADLWAAYTRILRLSEELDLGEPA
jgi:tetratricopeptide (TPR) repeat protein